MLHITEIEDDSLGSQIMILKGCLHHIFNKEIEFWFEDAKFVKV